MAKGPEVVKTGAILNKNNVKVTMDTVNKLGVAATNDPVKLRKPNIVDRIMGLGSMAMFIEIALIMGADFFKAYEGFFSSNRVL
ncbi:unnamed protein product [Phytophthora fragariaefolia]|uniref:Unnamed protein product n=1 Tax=Phytophthora fragariaefolia TaxID=1490495 RepID=A0A9W6XMJ6_9STRA|nr:unnamed protein product [Phytophthora fragariaefolia]